MRHSVLTACALATTLGAATTGAALERTAVRITDESHTDDWSAGSTCYIAYYNYCTGWIWTWSGWSPGDCLGVCFDSCCSPGHGYATGVWMLVWTSAPSGYGFTGTINVYDADADCCMLAPIDDPQPFLPYPGWNLYLFDAMIGQRFVVSACLGSGSGNPIVFSTDHPAVGPTGPIACGHCYPVTRDARSYYYGTVDSPLCPGSPFNDGVCDAALIWEAYVVCTVSVEATSWGKIKDLYR